MEELKLLETLTEDELKTLLKAFKILEDVNVNLRLSIANIEETIKKIYVERVMNELVEK